jgi:membrane protein YqaA with SNARE-associated domain
VIATFLTTFGVCFFSAVIPIVNAELYLLAASALVGPHLTPFMIVGAALGQMAGKSLLYYAGSGALNLPSERLRRMVEGVQNRYRDGAAAPALGGTVLFASASVGLPPFYVVTIASGIFRIPFVHFFVVGLLGMLVRCAVVVLGPQLVKGAA